MKSDIPAHSRIRAHIREHAIQLTGSPSSGMEIAGMIRILANLYENQRALCSDNSEISSPRMAILYRLMAEENQGRTAGVTPSELSRYQNVSRNTISALLRGLEQQGLIERRLDEQDKRVFRIGLTPNGRDLVQKTGPRMIHAATRLASDLTSEEQEHLLDLLTRLFLSLKHHIDYQEIDPDPKE